MTNYKVLATWDISIQNLYKDITLIQQGISCKLNISLRSISRVTVNYKVGNEYVTDLCTIDLDNNKVIVPFKKNVLEVGTHALELVCHMKNGDVLPTPNYSYTVTKSLTNDNDITEEDAYPVLIGMIQELTAKENIIQANEEARANAEMYRELNEDERQNAEAERKANENTRLSNENTRQSNESSRQQYETQRRVEEDERLTDEQVRVNAENIRIANENERLRKEIERQNAEELRQIAYNSSLYARMDEVELQLAHIENVKTVQDLKNINLKLNTIVQTCGYYETNDGGANTYIVIPGKEFSYDIKCKEYAIRPVAISDTVCPKQFGTVNDGINGDNIGLQACFDFVRDYNIGVIDGRNLLYTTDSSTQTYHNHYGVVIHQPVTLRNYRGQVKDDIGHFTAIIDMIQVENDFREYLIENCEFNGKYGVVTQSTVGTEDGGRHCIVFYPSVYKTPKDFIPMGNITIRNCRFIKPDAYGISMHPADCIYTVENCTFNTNGPCVLSYATTMIAKNCTATINSSYKVMVLNFLHDEIEMNSNYQGVKLKNFYIDNCHQSGGSYLLKTHNSTQGALSYDKIYINNSTSSDSEGLFSMYQTYKDKPTTVNSINICDSSGRLTINGLIIDKIVFSNLTNSGRVYLASEIDTLRINNFEFDANNSLYLTDGCKLQNLYLNECKSIGKLSTYWDGICSISSTEHDKIVNLYINNFKWINSSRFIETGVENIYIDDLYINGDTDENYFDFIYNINSNGCKKFILKNSIFEIPTPDYQYLLYNKNTSTGNGIIANCVYSKKLNIYPNGMNLRQSNVVNLNDDE